MDSGGGGSDVRLTSFVVDHHDTTQNDVSCIIMSVRLWKFKDGGSHSEYLYYMDGYKK